jgi:hypothetical protein
MARQLATGLGVGLLFLSSWLFAIGVLDMGGWGHRESTATAYGIGIFLTSSIGGFLVSRRST